MRVCLSAPSGIAPNCDGGHICKPDRCEPDHRWFPLTAGSRDLPHTEANDDRILTASANPNCAATFNATGRAMGIQEDTRTLLMSGDEIRAALRGSAAFDEATDAEIATLARACSIEEIPPGTVVLKEGDEPI